VQVQVLSSAPNKNYNINTMRTPCMQGVLIVFSAKKQGGT